MPLPGWLAQVNKRVFNKLEVRRGVRPVVTHVGRRSGAVYQTPLDAHRVDGGFIFILNYGATSDWVQNILASGSAELRAGEDRYQLTAPRVLGETEAWEQLPEGTKPVPDWVKVTEYLRMDVSPEG